MAHAGSATREQRSPTATIRIEGYRAAVDPADLDLAGLVAGHEDWDPVAPRDWDRSPIEFDGRGRYVIAAGLVPRVQAFLEARGHAVEVVDATRPHPSVRLADRWDRPPLDSTKAFARRLQANRRGLLVPRPGDLPAFVALVARLFPRARVTVAVGSRDEARSVRDRLQGYLGEPVDLVVAWPTTARNRVRVATPEHADPHRGDVTIFADAAQALTVRGRGLLAWHANQHAYGLLAPGVDLGPRRRFGLEATFGPVLYRTPGPEGKRAIVRVLLAEAPACAVPAGLDGLGRKRAATWANGRRNDVVASIARAMADGRLDLLAEHGIFLDREGHGPAEAAGVPQRVAVLVESPEHGRELARRLPGWPLVTRSSAAKGGDGRNSIVTLVAAQSGEHLDVDALIRADGGVGLPRLPGFPPPCTGDDPQAVYLIDLRDDGDELAFRTMLGRRDAYARQGWQLDARFQGLEQGPAPATITTPTATRRRARAKGAAKSHPKGTPRPAGRRRGRRRGLDREGSTD